MPWFYHRRHVVGLVPTSILVLLAIAPDGCASKRGHPSLSATDSTRVVTEILAHRAEADSFFRFDEASPFRVDTAIRYDGIKWYPPNVNFSFSSRLHTYPKAETVVVLGTKGEERKHVRYGYFLLDVEGKEVRLNVYKFIPSDAGQYSRYKDLFNVWFTDRTTGKETYGVGRYLDVGPESPDPEFLYTVDFNNAYSPYCAYSTLYSCAVPRREDHLDVEIRAGEMTYKEHH